MADLPEFRIPLEKYTIAGSTVTFDLPHGLRYKQLVFEVGDTDKSGTSAPALADVIGEMRFDFAGEQIRKISATHLDAIQTDYDADFASTAVAGGSGDGAGRRIFTVYFAEPQRGDLRIGNLLGLDTSWLPAKDGLKLQMDLVDPTHTVFRAYAIMDEQRTGKHPIVFMDTIPVNIVGSSLLVSDELDEDGEYLQLTITDTTDSKTCDHVLAKFTNAKGKKEEFHNLPKTINKHLLKSVAQMGQTTGYYHIVNDASGTLNPSIPARGLEIKPTFSAAATGQFSIITQRLAIPG